MMVLYERQKSVIRDTLEILGQHTRNEVVANLAMMIQTISRADQNKPQDIESQLAITYFFLETLKMHWGVDNEVLHNSIDEVFTQMDAINKDTQAKFKEAEEKMAKGEDPEHVDAEPIIPDGVPGGDLMGLASMFGALSGMGEGEPMIDPEKVVEGEVRPVSVTPVDDSAPIETESVVECDAEKSNVKVPVNPKDVPSVEDTRTQDTPKRRGRPKAVRKSEDPEE